MNWCVSVLFSEFCFRIRHCNSDMKIEKTSVNALSTDNLSSSIRSKMFQTHFLKMFLNFKCFHMLCQLLFKEIKFSYWI